MLLCAQYTHNECLHQLNPRNTLHTLYETYSIELSEKGFRFLLYILSVHLHIHHGVEVLGSLQRGFSPVSANRPSTDQELSSGVFRRYLGRMFQKIFEFEGKKKNLKDSELFHFKG